MGSEMCIRDSGSLFLSAGSDGTDMSDIPGSALDEGEENVLLGAGEIHNHLNFDLDLDDASAVGAVGLLLQFEADLASTPGAGIDVVSNPFFFVINNGLDEEVFDSEVLAAFGVEESAAIPEPTTGILLAGVGGALLTRRRKRRV